MRITPNWNLKGAHKKGINGEGITIAILDSGVNVNHDYFTKNHIHLSGKNFISNGKGDDYWRTNREAHGTIMTGIVAQYAPKAKIYVCCVSDHKEDKYYPDAIIKALKHLRDEKKCEVIVMSFGHYSNCGKEKERKERKEREQLISQLAEKGVICVAAIGNYGRFADSLANPAHLDQVIAVGGLKKCDKCDERDECDHKSVESDINPPGKIDVFAPGEDVYAPVDDDNSKYRKVTGTSYAAPAIGGIVALLMQLAHGSGNVIDSVELVKTIFSQMILEVPTTMPNRKEKNVEVLNPAYFFGEYDTPYKFSVFFPRV